MSSKRFTIEEELLILSKRRPLAKVSLTQHISTTNSSGLNVTLNFYSNNTYRIGITNSPRKNAKELGSSEDLIAELQAYGVDESFIKRARALNEQKLSEIDNNNKEA